jgi:hypothetical protein
MIHSFTYTLFGTRNSQNIGLLAVDFLAGNACATWVKTRLKITSVLTRAHVSNCTQGSKCCYCRKDGTKLPAKVWNAACRPPAVKKLAILPAYGRLLSLQCFCKAAGQGCRARLPGKAAGQGCRAKLPGPGKAAGQGCRARLSGKAVGQCCRARLPGIAAGQGCRARQHCNGTICWKHGEIGE